MQRRTWVVGIGDGATIADIVRRIGGGPEVISEGRVFIGKKRVIRADEPVSIGDEVFVSIAASDGARVSILHSGDGLLVIDKPAGLSTIADQTSSADTALALAAASAGIEASKLHPTSRLDREVSGVVTFATSKKSAAQLMSAREAGAYERRYVAIACKKPNHEHGIWDAAIGRARDPKLRAAFASSETKNDAKPSRTRYRVVAESSGHALIALGPETGRTHQIRVHASHAGAPLLGDRAYGGSARLVLPSGKIVQCTRIYLHCARVEITKNRKKHIFFAPIPADLRDAWASLGGEPTAWDTALACDLSFSSV